MLSRLELLIDKPVDRKINYSIASKLHGFLMESIDSSMAEKLHELYINPYSQHIDIKDKYIVWTINGLNQEAYERIIKSLYPLEKIDLKSLDLSLDIKSKQLSEISLDNFFAEQFESDKSRYLNLRFNTATSFKSQGKHIFYPDFSLIFKSLINKHDEFAKNSLYTDHLLEEILANIEVKSYNLKSIGFKVDNFWIPSFIGDVSIFLRGPEALKDLIHYILAYGEYSGVGAKTALGMGNIKKE